MKIEVVDDPSSTWPKEDGLKDQMIDVLKGVYKFQHSTKQNIDSFWKKIKGSSYWIYGKFYINDSNTHYYFELSFKEPIYSWEARYWYASAYAGEGINEFIDDIEDAFSYYSNAENAEQTREVYNRRYSFPPDNGKATPQIEDEE